MADPTDVRVRTGLWRFGAQRARLDLRDDLLTVTSVDPETDQPNALIVSARLDRAVAWASGSVITLEVDGNPYRIDFAGRGWSKRITQWRSVLEFAGLPVPYRSMHPLKAVLLALGIGVVVGPYALSLYFFLVTRVAELILDPLP